MKNIAIILAGGIGQRLGEPIPKQFLKVAGKKVIEHTLDVFQNHPLIDEIAVVSNPYYIQEVENIFIKNRYSKLKKILQGGKERCHSSLAAINAYDTGEEVNLIFHDAVRPLVNDRIISDCISALDIYDAVDVAIKTTDTIIQADDENRIIGIPPRHFLRNGQTPQAFKLSVIKRAYELALQDPEFKTTDDCGVVYKYLPDKFVYIVEGELFNMKLTYKEDLFLLDKLFQLRSVSLQNTGITVLQDEAIELNYGDECIQLIGLNDPDFSERDSFLSESILEAKLSQVNISDGFTILLSHRPEYFNVYQNKNIDLVLSGHAHGGQFRLPLGGGVIAPGQGLFPKYDAGIYTENGTTMIVSRGIGNSIIPVRINNPPEIVIIELNCG